jgi:hypothetical protein
LEHVEKEFGDEQVGDQDYEGRDDERHNSGSANARRSTFYAESLIAAYGRNDKSKNKWFREPQDQVAKYECVNGARHELFRAQV